MKKKIIIGLACLTAGIGLAGCGASNSNTTKTTTADVTTTAETTTETTTAETTTVETTTVTTEAPTTTTTEAPTTTTTEAWMADFANAKIMPSQNPYDVWGNIETEELVLPEGVHVYLPTYDMDGHHTNYVINDIPEIGHTTISEIGQEKVLDIYCDVSQTQPENDASHRYYNIGNIDGNEYNLCITPGYFPGYGGFDEFFAYSEMYYNAFWDKICASTWVE